MAYPDVEIVRSGSSEGGYGVLEQALPPVFPSTLYGGLRHFGSPQLNFRLVLRYVPAFAIHVVFFPLNFISHGLD